MKIPIICDTHFGARSDSVPMQKSMQKFYERVFFPKLDELGCTQLLHGGDSFDRRKYVNYQTANWVRENYREPLRKRRIQEHAIIGNHDIYYKSSTDINSVTELYRDDPNIIVYTHPVEIDVDGLGILMLPWITDNNRELSETMIATSKAQVVLGHLELSGFQMYRGVPHMGGMEASAFDRFGLVMSGHFHHKSEDGIIKYLGAPYPMIWSDYRDPRGFHIFDTDTLELEFVENPFGIFKRIVYDDEGKAQDYVKELVQSIQQKDGDYQDAYVKVIIKSKTQPYWFELVMDSLYKMNAQDIIVVDDVVVNDDDTESQVETTHVDTLGLMNDFIDSLTINANKTDLKTYMTQTYHNALNASKSVRMS